MLPPDRQKQKVCYLADRGFLSVDHLCRRFPEHWLPDLVFFSLSSSSGPIPSFLWHAPAPIIGIALDPEPSFHAVRLLAPGCDLLLASSPSAERFQRPGCGQVRAFSPGDLLRAAPNAVEDRQSSVDQEWNRYGRAVIRGMAEVMVAAAEENHPLLLESADYWLAFGLSIGRGRPEVGGPVHERREGEDAARELVRQPAEVLAQPGMLAELPGVGELMQDQQA